MGYRDLTGTGAEQAGQWAGLDGDRIVYGVTETTLRLRADPGGEYFTAGLSTMVAVLSG